MQTGVVLLLLAFVLMVLSYCLARRCQRRVYPERRAWTPQSRRARTRQGVELSKLSESPRQPRMDLEFNDAALAAARARVVDWNE